MKQEKHPTLEGDLLFVKTLQNGKKLTPERAAKWLAEIRKEYRNK